MTETDDRASLSEQLASLPPARRPWLRLFVPDLAVCLAVVAVFCALVFFNAPQDLFRDSRTAVEIRTHLVLGLAYRVAGFSGAAWLSLVMLGVVTWLWVRFHWSTGGNFFLTLALFVPFVAMLPEHLRATSSLIGWIFLLAFLLYFENVRAHFNWRILAVLAIGAALWENLDRSFLFLPLMAVFYAFSHLIRPLIWPVDQREEWKRAKWFGVVAALTLAAGWVSNPYGLHLPEPPSPSPIPVFALGLVCIGGVLALTQTKVAHFLLTVFFAVYAPALVVLLLPIANGSMTAGLRKSHSFRAQLRRRVTEFLQRSDHVRLVDARFSGLLWTAPAALLLLGWLLLPMVSARTGFPRSEFPVDSVAEFAALPQNIRVLAPPKYADYLFYRFGGGVPVFVRSEELGPGWREEIDRAGITHALLPLNSPLALALETLKWKAIIEDNASVLLRRPD